MHDDVIITITTKRGGNHDNTIIVSVKDNGTGIDKESCHDFSKSLQQIRIR
jgi:sensor histidine kinase YesM